MPRPVVGAWRPCTSTRRSERRAEGEVDPARTGVAVAILAGDLAAVLADGLFLDSGFEAERLTNALTRYQRMRVEMAAGQYLDLVDADVDARRLAQLKGGAYTVRWPLSIGAALAGASEEIDVALERFAEPLGQAFQLADDLRDGDARPGVDRDAVRALVAEARATLASAPLDPVAMRAMDALAAVIG